MTETPAGSVLAVCRVHELHPDEGTVGVTAIDKRPVDGPVHVRPLGLYGDLQADRKNHGGLDQAIYAYAQEDIDYWGAELGRDIPPGLFGENLRTRGIDASGAVIGQRWRIGDHVVLEVTSPRVPCATFARRMGEPRWVKRFTEAGRIGTYLRVLHKGKLAAGDPIEIEFTPDHGITVGKFFANPTVEDVRTLQGLHDAGELHVAESYQPYFERILARQQ
ncbi:MOSC domain-containing protein [Arthrobacter sp. GMC3]|uniref:MOSC domain-containing protein n=1 Tax=Arthrobacter sp. GMC3 TaxID=2058894 RepID=UPI000CE56172|nr:MOSC domain-containing protein [Arthrobacter sp. GMC3]